MTQQNCTRRELVKPQRRDYLRILNIRFLRLVYRYRTNSPYISGDSIAENCDYYAYGKFGKRRISLLKLRSAKSIFVPGHLLFDFLEAHKLDINAHTLVSGNSDQNYYSTPDLPPSIKLFLCQNHIKTEDERVHSLPIGLENLRLGRSGRVKFHTPQESFEITNRVLVPPMSPTNPVRMKVMEEAKEIPTLFDIPTRYMNERDYFSLTKKYRFILTLEGNGFENHRIWESLYQGSIPVILKSPWSESLREYGFPLLYVDSISEICETLLAETNQTYQGFDPAKLDTLWIPFWKEMINSGNFFLESPK